MPNEFYFGLVRGIWLENNIDLFLKTNLQLRIFSKIFSQNLAHMYLGISIAMEIIFKQIPHIHEINIEWIK